MIKISKDLICGISIGMAYSATAYIMDGATNKETRLHIDHIIPVAQGGSDELSNLQTLCRDCNLAKSNRAWKGGVV